MEQSQSVVIEDVNQFVTILMAWHSMKVKTLEHMLLIPEGTLMAFGEEPETALEGKYLAGFKAGIELSLIELGSLPFISDEVTDVTSH